MAPDGFKAEDPFKLGFEIVTADANRTALEAEWKAEVAPLKHEPPDTGKRPMRLQPSMKKLVRRRAKNKQAKASRKRNRQ